MRSKSLLWSFDYAVRGIVYALRTQRNMRIHVAVAGLVFVAALLLGVGDLELLALLLSVGFVIVAELLNTAIETVVDLSTEGFDPLAAIAKDVAAGAVLISALTALGVGYVVFVDRLTPFAQRGLDLVRAGPATITVIALALTGIAVFTVKALRHERGASFVHGGWPSGHTAVAFAAASAIGYSVASAKVWVLALFIAGIVAQSRVESGAHTIPQTIAGALLGFLLATAVFQIFWT
jgi:diacylglycerol kinase (ATP)